LVIELGFIVSLLSEEERLCLFLSHKIILLADEVLEGILFLSLFAPVRNEGALFHSLFLILLLEDSLILSTVISIPTF